MDHGHQAAQRDGDTEKTRKQIEVEFKTTEKELSEVKWKRRWSLNMLLLKLWYCQTRHTQSVDTHRGPLWPDCLKIHIQIVSSSAIAASVTHAHPQSTIHYRDHCSVVFH